MSEKQGSLTYTQISDQVYLLLQKIPSIQQLDELITLCCTSLDAAIFINDAQGNILAHSPLEDSPCPAWSKRIQKGHVQSFMKGDGRSLRPFINTMKHDKCTIDGCTRLYLPLLLEDNPHPFTLNLFFWRSEIGHHEQMLASIFAGAFASLLQQQQVFTATQHEKQTRLLRELLDYKAGLKQYYRHMLVQADMDQFSTAFRILYIQPNRPQKAEEPLMLNLAHGLEHTWIVAHDGCLLIIFNEERLSVKKLPELLLPWLTEQQMTACLSLPFYDLLKLRSIFEDCQHTLPIAIKKEPDTRIHMAEHYQCMAFLSRCQQYFPLQDYYPESLTRLMEYDRENNRRYLTTLTAYLENNMNANAAAKQIFMHRNTMMQQIEKIEQIMGISLEDKEMCLYLQLCLRIHELLNM